MQRLTEPRWKLLLAAALAGAVLMACQHEMKRTSAPTPSAQQAPFADPGAPDSSERQRDTGGELDVEAGPGERSADPSPVAWEQNELDPQETARRVEEEDAVPLCSVLDSISIGDRGGRPVFRMHVGDTEPIEFAATGELERVLGFWSQDVYIQSIEARKPVMSSKSVFRWSQDLVFEKGCGYMLFIDSKQNNKKLINKSLLFSLFDLVDAIVLLFRHMESSQEVEDEAGELVWTKRFDRAGVPFWAAQRESSVDMILPDPSRRRMRGATSGPRMELTGPVGQQVGQVETGSGDTLRLALSRLRAYGEWRQMPEGMYAREAGHVYPHVLLYLCDYTKEEHQYCGYTEEDFAFILGNAPGLPDPVHRYVAYRVEEDQIATRDTVLTLRTPPSPMP